MCRQFGMAIAPWDAIGSGKLCTQKQLDERKAKGEKFRGGADDRTELEIKYSEVLAKIAKEHGIESVTAVALACAAFHLMLQVWSSCSTLQTSWPRRPTSSPSSAVARSR